MTDLCAAPVASGRGMCTALTGSALVAACRLSYQAHVALDDGSLPLGHHHQSPIKAVCGHPWVDHESEFNDGKGRQRCNVCVDGHDHAYVPGETCPDCGGEGVVGIESADADGRPVYVREADCPTCHGLKVVPKEVSRA